MTRPADEFIRAHPALKKQFVQARMAVGIPAVIIAAITVVTTISLFAGKLFSSAFLLVGIPSFLRSATWCCCCRSEGPCWIPCVRLPL